MKYRTEKDSLGEMKIPENSYYGIFTERVLGNFKITEQKIPGRFLMNYILIKKIYADVNCKSGKIDRKISGLIKKACDKILNLKADDFLRLFQIDTIQSGGGTSTNMMVNEVIANFANPQKGKYFPIHPNDHVNMSQSSNDTFPGVIKVTTYQQIDKLIFELKKPKNLMV